jgi:hypothetical protein
MCGSCAAAAATAASPDASQLPPPPPPAADAELSQPAVEASPLMIYADGVAVPAGSGAAAADADAKALLEEAGVQGSF